MDLSLQSSSMSFGHHPHAVSHTFWGKLQPVSAGPKWSNCTQIFPCPPLPNVNDQIRAYMLWEGRQLLGYIILLEESGRSLLPPVGHCIYNTEYNGVGQHHEREGQRQKLWQYYLTQKGKHYWKFRLAWTQSEGAGCRTKTLRNMIHQRFPVQ